MKFFTRTLGQFISPRRAARMKFVTRTLGQFTFLARHVA